jgi:hypothetical protein
MSSVCGSTARRFLPFSRLSPVDTSRKLTPAIAAKNMMSVASQREIVIRPLPGRKLRGKWALPSIAAFPRPIEASNLRRVWDGFPPFPPVFSRFSA